MPVSSGHPAMFNDIGIVFNELYKSKVLFGRNPGRFADV
jgi:hypothetical protein